MFMMANQLRVNNEQRMGIVITDEMKHEFISFWQEHTDRPITAREFIVKSLCPQVTSSSHFSSPSFSWYVYVTALLGLRSPYSQAGTATGAHWGSALYRPQWLAGAR